MPFLQNTKTNPTNLGTSARLTDDELETCDYHLTVDGKLTGVFTGLTGGDMTISKMEYNLVFESGLSTTLLIPGATTFHPFSLTRGYGNYAELYNWFMEASNGMTIQARRSGSVYMKKAGTTILQWDFDNAWPTKLSGFSYNQYQAASSARISITIVPETIKLVAVP